MDVRELVEGYCQVTGRPTFTITVDEYIKFHQVAMVEASKSNVGSSFIKEQKIVEERHLGVKEEAVEVKQGMQSFNEEEEKVKERPLPIEKQVPKKEEKPKEKPKNVDKKQVALELLKSIQG